MVLLLVISLWFAVCCCSWCLSCVCLCWVGAAVGGWILLVGFVLYLHSVGSGCTAARLPVGCFGVSWCWLLGYWCWFLGCCGLLGGGLDFVSMVGLFA